LQSSLKEITVRDLSKGYKDNAEGGVIGFNGKLDIRPPYQREFVYKDRQRDAVINTVRNDFPLNIMYWAVRDDGSFEVIDGQQRTISICQYVVGDFSIGGLGFHNLPKDKQEQILNYKLTIYLCSGTDSEKLDWFKIVNIAGEKLYDQELRNAIYTGTWLSDAKRHFSKSGCPAYSLASGYMKGSPIRQDYLETTISWISNGKIEEYMGKHQHKPNANELWLYFQKVISWIKAVFPKYRKEMKGVDFGTLYNEFGDKEFDQKKIEKEIVQLMQDDDVTKKSGIYPYIITRNEKYLNIRSFTDKMKREAYEKQKGICPKCKKHFEIEEMEADHIKPWHEGGKTIAENCQMLCKQDNRIKSGK
jgi:hypothetical protein